MPTGCSEPLGLKNNTIPDSQITASSSYKTWNLRAFGWYPHLARLDMQGKINAWTAQSNSDKEWLQVGVGGVCDLCPAPYSARDFLRSLSFLCFSSFSCFLFWLAPASTKTPKWKRDVNAHAHKHTFTGLTPILSAATWWTRLASGRWGRIAGGHLEPHPLSKMQVFCHLL